VEMLREEEKIFNGHFTDQWITRAERLTAPI
jgi:hypothetical protein